MTRGISSQSSLPYGNNILNTKIIIKLTNEVSKLKTLNNKKLDSQYDIFIGFWNNSDIDPYDLWVNVPVVAKNPCLGYSDLEDVKASFLIFLEFDLCNTLIYHI